MRRVYGWLSIDGDFSVAVSVELKKQLSRHSPLDVAASMRCYLATWLYERQSHSKIAVDKLASSYLVQSEVQIKSGAYQLFACSCTTTPPTPSMGQMHVIDNPSLLRGKFWDERWRRLIEIT
jgi:hypothetical protein